MRHSVRKQYGDWVSWLKQVEQQVQDDELDPDTVEIIVGGQSFPIGHQELQKVFNAAFRATKHDHPDANTDSWCTSFYKRFWGQLKCLRQTRKEEYRQRQLDQLQHLTTSPDSELLS